MHQLSTCYLKTVFVLSILSALGACRKHYVPTGKSEYKQYAMGNDIPIDSGIVRYYMPYKRQMETEMNRVVGKTNKALTKPTAPETLMGNYFAEALLTEARKKDPAAQFSLGTRGGLRVVFPAGDIRVNNVFELMPFENEMVTLRIGGENLKKLLDFIVKKDGAPVAGLRMKIHNGKAADVIIDGKPYDPDAIYTLVSYDYLANGGDDLECLKSITDRKNLGIKVREALLENISDLTRQGKSINAELDGRIVIE